MLYLIKCVSQKQSSTDLGQKNTLSKHFEIRKVGKNQSLGFTILKTYSPAPAKNQWFLIYLELVITDILNSDLTAEWI